jgi:transposase
VIDEIKRQEVLELRHKEPKMGSRKIARLLSMPRSSVRRILDSNSSAPPQVSRPLNLTPHLETIRQLYVDCRGNQVRVAEELAKKLQESVPYSTLTAFCRAHKFGRPRPSQQPAGRYVTGPGVEMQHDTSPIPLVVGGVERVYQAASLKLGFSLVRFLVFYRRFRRFECKDFLTRAFQFLLGLCQRCVIDNTSVIVAHGSGPNAVIAPEMAAFEQRYAFRFWAHRIGDADRSAKVERDFDFIQRNFVPGRHFTDDADLNAQALQWCLDKNDKPNDKTGRVPSALLLEERPHLVCLPVFVPSVYQLHTRVVDSEGFVQLDGNRYSTPGEFLRKTLTVRETMDTLTLVDGARIVAVHPRAPEGQRAESLLPEHKRRPRSHERRRQVSPEEAWLVAQSETLKTYVAGLKRLGSRRLFYQIRKLYALCHEYAVADVERVTHRAVAYDLYDAARLETMLLQDMGAKLFGLPPTREGASVPGISIRPRGHVTPVGTADTSAAAPPHTEPIAAADAESAATDDGATSASTGASQDGDSNG